MVGSRRKRSIHSSDNNKGDRKVQKIPSYGLIYESAATYRRKKVLFLDDEPANLVWAYTRSTSVLQSPTPSFIKSEAHALVANESCQEVFTPQEFETMGHNSPIRQCLSKPAKRLSGDAFGMMKFNAILHDSVTHVGKTAVGLNTLSHAAPVVT